MKKKSFETIIYSVGGVAALLVILIAFNVITAACKERIDLTKEKAYTLTPGTKAILGKLDAPVKIRFYYSQSSGGANNVIALKTYAQRVEDLLAEYKQASKGRVIIEKFDPEPDSDAEDSAHVDGVEGQLLSNGEKFYLGLAVHAVDATEAIPFLDPNRERLLEYDLSRAISRVANPEKPVIGVMSSLPVFGTQSNPMMMRMGQRGQDPWIFINELKSDYTVKQVEMTADKIDDDIKLLVVIHPKDISDKAQYAIDQFIMRGGKLVAFLDGLCMVDKTGQNLGQMQLPAGGSSLDKLLKAWGLQFDTGKVVADMNLKMRMGGRNGQPVEAPAVLSVTSDGLNKDDVATSEIDNIWLPFCGAFTGTPVSGLKETVLVKSTKDSQLVEGIMASMAGENIMKDFKPSGVEYALAVRLTGKFKTAFPDGPPAEKKEDDKSDKKSEKPAETLKETKTDNAVVLFGDSDFLYDEFTVRQMQTPFGVLSQPLNANLNLAQNFVEQLTGDNNLISVRSRATLNRPFTRIREMQAHAQEAYQSKIKELEASLQETQQRVNELQRNKEKGQRFILSPEQQAELENFKKKEADVRVQLKQVRKNLAHDIDSMENRLKWGNIIGMPLVVALSGIGIAVFKRKRTSAK